MEVQKKIKTICVNCKKEIIVPTVTDFGISFQIAPAECECGWKQTGKWLNPGFIADDLVKYYNLRNLQ